MDTELLSRARTQDIEREISRIRLAAAAESARSQHRRAASNGKPRGVPGMPLRVLRALRQSA
jgi:hypothetical protein